jgi:hypothetical protein
MAISFSLKDVVNLEFPCNWIGRGSNVPNSLRKAPQSNRFGSIKLDEIEKLRGDPSSSDVTNGNEIGARFENSHDEEGECEDEGEKGTSRLVIGLLGNANANAH